MGAASAVTVAGEMGVGLQVVWQPEWPCSDGCPDDAPFVAGWPDLFSDPPLRLADTFPGWTPNWDSEGSGGSLSHCCSDTVKAE